MRLPTLKLPVRLGGLVQCEGLSERDAEGPVRDPFLELPAGSIPVLRRVGSKPEAADPETPIVELFQIDGRGRATGLAEIGQVTIATQPRRPDRGEASK